ncbi:hypothetical protein KP509_36G059100 [Ceratopteris richardii]|uniref:GEX2 N-terminal Ig-like domain-containing protein n=1 Tax=Ceratopteris richardii TaxID=49495 RepID=A0A8T2QEU6_CERRI|nr:hypothetical protein KP509_36G059100 [Ceratopteris richardii]
MHYAEIARNFPGFLFLIFSGLGLHGVVRAAYPSIVCSYYSGGQRYITVQPYKTYQLKIVILGDCTGSCSTCQPYVDYIERFNVLMESRYSTSTCSWDRIPPGSNLYNASCKLDRLLYPNAYRSYTFQIYIWGRPFVTKVATVPFYYISGDLYPRKCGPLIWTSYPANSLEAGKQASFKIQLRDAAGFPKNISTGIVTTAERTNFIRAVVFSFSNQIRNLSSQFSIEEGTVSYSFLPITCGVWMARAGVVGYTGAGPPIATLDGSPFQLIIKPGDIFVQNSKGFWLNNISVFRAGQVGTLRVLLMDAYMNNITKSTGRIDFYNFKVYSSDNSGAVAPCNVSLSQEQQFGFEDILINNTLIGTYKLHVQGTDSQIMSGSPFAYNIIPGDLWIEECTGKWFKSDQQVAGRTCTLFVTLKDRYGNAKVDNKEIIKFNVYTNSGGIVYEKANYTFQNSLAYFEYITFISTRAGIFSYHVSYGNKEIKDSPFNLTILPGAVEALASKGFWNDTNYFVKGKMAVLEVILMDAYNNIVNASSAPLLFSIYFLFSNGTKFSQPYTQIGDPQSGHAFIKITVTMGNGIWPCYVLYNSNAIGGSPFRYAVFSGSNLTNVFVSWKNNVTTFEGGKLMQEDLEFRDPLSNILDVTKLNFNLSFHLDNPEDEMNCFNESYYPTSQFGHASFFQRCFYAGTFHGYVLMNSTKSANDLPAFKIIPGPIYIPYCLGSFSNSQTIFKAGELITFDVLLEDAFNNTVSQANGRSEQFDFTVQFIEVQSNASVAPRNFSHISRRGSGHEIYNFSFIIPGSYLMYLGGAQGQATLHWRDIDGQLASKIVPAHQAQTRDAPYSFKVVPSDPYIPFCGIAWKDNISTFTPLGKAILYITPRDVFNNTINLTSSFQNLLESLQVSTASKSSGSSNPVSFAINSSEPYITFNVSTKTGNYLLYVGDGSKTADESPLFYNIIHGPLSVEDTSAIWPNESTEFKAGTYFISIMYNGTSIMGSPFSFTILPGPLSAEKSIGGPWLDNKTEFRIGEKAILIVQLMDIYGNRISVSDGIPQNMNTTVNCNNGQFIGPLNLTLESEDNSSMQAIFLVSFSGECVLSITNGTANISGSPFTFSSYSGNIFIPACIGSWANNTNIFFVGNEVSLEVTFRNSREQLVQPVYPYTQFKIDLTLSNGSLYKSAIDFIPGKNATYGIITLNITLSGNFSLYVGNKTHQIRNSPFHFQMLPGAISAQNSEGMWPKDNNVFKSGDTVTLNLRLFDIYKNRITSSMNNSFLVFYSTWSNGSLLYANHDFDGIIESDALQFNTKQIGEFLLYISDCQKHEIIGSPFKFSVAPGDVQNFRVYWLNNVSIFEAGTPGALEILLTDEYNNPVANIDYEYLDASFEAFIRPTTDRQVVADLRVLFESNINKLTVSFLAISSGEHYLHVLIKNQSIQGSPFSFTVIPGVISSRNCRGYWLDGRNTFKAGDVASLVVKFEDAFNNKVTSESKPLVILLTSEGLSNNKSYNVKDIEVMPGYQIVTFIVIASGNASLHVTDGNEISISGSPFSLIVNPGLFSILNTTAEWQYGVNIFEINSVAKLFIYPRDLYSNPLSLDVPNLQAFVYQVNSNQPLTSPDLSITRHPAISWIQVLSFTTGTIGKFKIYVRDSFLRDVVNSPFSFEVFEGSTDPKSSVIFGSGLTQAASGELASFSIELRDFEGKPSESPLSAISVLFNNDNTDYPTNFREITSLNFHYEENLQATASPASSQNVSIITQNSTGTFEVKYSITPGHYDLYVLWTNVLLNDGTPFALTVIPGSVDISRCQCQKKKYDPGIKVNVWNYINVSLEDGSAYGVSGEANSLRVSITSVGKYKVMDIVDNGDGSYVLAYMPLAVSSYNIVIKYDSSIIPSCSITEYAHSEYYYPWAEDDYVQVIQGRVAVIDVLQNDTNGFGSLFLYNITEEPVHGTSVIYNQAIIYVPVLGYVGDDKFIYAIKDQNSNLGFGEVTIQIKAESPKISASSDILQALEDEPITFYGDRNTIVVTYWNESSTLTSYLKIEHGSLYKGAYASHLWFPSLDGTSGKADTLFFQGSVNVINEFFQSLLYIGPTNFNGENSLFISVMDDFGNSVNKSIQIIIEPVNDPPYILVPFKVMVQPDGSMWNGYFENSTMFTNGKDSQMLEVGDPDAFDVQEDFEELQVEILLQVDEGMLSIIMPIDAQDSLKYKQANGQWIPFNFTVLEMQQQFALVAAQAITFRLSINDSNNALQTLKYQGTSTTILSIIVNDMGQWGCHSNCLNGSTSLPLSDSKRIILSYGDAPRGYLQKKTFGTIFSILAIIAAIAMFVFIPWVMLNLDHSRHSKYIKLKKTYNKISAKDEADFHNTRVYNPHWIPTTSGDNQVHFSIGSNTVVSHIWQAKLKNCMNLAKDRVLRVIRR